MPFEMSFEGLDKISEDLEKLEAKAPAAAARGLYDGAAVMRKAIQEEAEKIKTAEFKYARSGKERLPSPEEKSILTAANVGVAKFDKNGTEVNTSVGYGDAGYSEMGLGRQKKRKAIAQVANAINSGTSFMRKQPFVRKAANSAKARAEEAIAKTINTELEKITK